MVIKTLDEFSNLLKKDNPLLSLDVGTKKVGLAISDKLKIISMPLNILYMDKNLLSNLNLTIKKYNIWGIIVGIPYNMDGTISTNADYINKLIEKIIIEFNQPIFLQDERLTTRLADSLLKMTGMKRKERNAVDDSISASLILETVLEKIKHIK